MANKLKRIVSAIAAAAVVLPTISVAFAEDGTQVGEYNFDNISTYIGDRFLQSNTGTTKDLEGGVQLANGSRKDGANGNTGWYPGTGKTGNAAIANLGQYVSSGRGPFVNLIVDEKDRTDKRLVTKFNYYPVNGTGNTADLYIVDPETKLDINGASYSGTETPTFSVGKDIVEKSWNTIEIITETDGTSWVIANDKLISEGSMTPFVYPQLQFTQTGSSKDLQSKGSIDDMELWAGGETDAARIAKFALNAVELDTTQSGISLEDGVYQIAESIKLPSPFESIQITWNIEQAQVGTEDWETTEYAAVNENTLSLAPAAGMDGYNYRLSASASLDGSASETKYFDVKLKTPAEVLEEKKAGIKIYDKETEAELVPVDGVYNISGDILFGQDETIDVAWECLDAEGKAISLIDENGVIYPTDYTDAVTLRANLSFAGAAATKDFSVKLISAVDTYINPVIDTLTVTSADDETVSYAANNIGTVNRDLKLPNKIKVSDGNVQIAWEVVSGDAVINDDVVEYMVEDFDKSDIKLAATFTYVKKNKELVSKKVDSIVYSVQFTKDDAASTDTAFGKYKVRFDAALEENFEDIPSETTSNISLPTEGKFGSKIDWSSSAPSVIKEDGTVSRASADKTVKLTASITSGTGSAEKTFEIKVPKKKSASGGGGGGGSTSSTGTVSNMGNSGTIASGTVIGTVGNTTSGEIVSQLQEEAASAKDLFKDISKAAWAREAINGLAQAGIVSGKSDTEFAPNDTVTRAEFAKMLMGVFGLNAGAYTTSSFNDVSTNAWYFNSVETAYNLGIITGVDNGKFAPDALITRQDMAVMVVRAAKVCGVALPEVEAEIIFADESVIADYAKTSVSELQKANIINGVTDTTFAPLENATRAQAAQILYNVISLVG